MKPVYFGSERRFYYRDHPRKRPRASIQSKVNPVVSRHERKFRDNALLDFSVPSSWSTADPLGALSLGSVAQGAGQSEHLGRTLYMTSIHVQGEFLMKSDDSSLFPFDQGRVRFAVVLDSDTKGQALLASDPEYRTFMGFLNLT